MTKKEICKNEQCLSCFHLAESRVEDADYPDEVTIVCQLELDGFEEIEGDICPQYRAFGEHKEEEEERETSLARKTYGSEDEPKPAPEPDRIGENVVKIYIFVGDKLVEAPIMGASQAVELEVNFVEAFNLKVEELKDQTENEITRLQGELFEKLQLIKDSLLAEGQPLSVEELFEEEIEVELDELEDEYSDPDYDDEDLDEEEE